MKKLILIVFVLILGIYGYLYFSAPINGDTQGGITVVLIDDSGAKIDTQIFEFSEETSLYDLMNENYDLGCANLSYNLDEECGTIILNSHVILKIDNVVTDWNSSYIQIFVNDVPSEFGIDDIMLKDETIYTFKYSDLGGDN